MAHPLTMLCAGLSLSLACRPAQTGLFEDCEGVRFSEEESQVGEPLLPPLEGAKNVLMVSIDTLRIDRVGRYGCEKISPFLDSLLASGTVLDNHHSCSSWTLPSATCVLTGRSPIDLGTFPRILTGKRIPDIPEGTETLASTLLDAGYRTLLLSSNLYISEKSQLDHGYQKSITKTKPSEVLLNTFLEEVDFLLAEDSEDPWFAHVHLLDPHTPYSPPESYLEGLSELPEISWDLSSSGGTKEMSEAWDALGSKERSDVGQHLVFRYGAEIRYLDDSLKDFFSKLEERGVLKDTLVVLWSDHGEQFWEHGDWGHGMSLHSGETRAFAAFLGPGVQAQGWNAPTTHTDIAPSILHALDLEIPEAFTGKIIGTQGASRPLFAATAPKNFPVTQSVSQGDKVLLYHWDGVKAFYDWSNDPFESDNQYDSEDPQVQSLWKLLIPEIEALELLLPEMGPAQEIGP
jgi:arylsulfatase A-like enzyme